MREGEGEGVGGKGKKGGGEGEDRREWARREWRGGTYEFGYFCEVVVSDCGGDEVAGFLRLQPYTHSAEVKWVGKGKRRTIGFGASTTTYVKHQSKTKTGRSMSGTEDVPYLSTVWSFFALTYTTIPPHHTTLQPSQ